MLFSLSFRRALGVMIVCASLCALSLSTAVAADKEDFGTFLVEVPEGWEAIEEGSAVIFLGPEEQSIVISAEIYEKPDEALMASISASGAEYRMLEDGDGYIFEANGYRTWGMLSKEGLAFSIAITDACPELSAIVYSLEAGAEVPAMEAAVDTVVGKDILDWLNFVSPSFAPADGENDADEPEMVEYNGEGLSASIPKGWTATPKDGGVAFMAADENEGVYARAVDLPSDDWDEFVKIATALRDEVDGKNSHIEEGAFVFMLEEGGLATLRPFDKKMVAVFTYGNSPAARAVFVDYAGE